MTLEQIFARELNQNLNSNGSKDIYKIPLPRTWEVSGTAMYGVNNIEDEYYSKLNYTLVKKVPTGTKVVKRKIDKVKRGFAKDEEGNYINEEYKIPVGCIAVTSEVNLGLPYKYTCKEDCHYVDFVEKEGRVEYIYCIPKVFLFPVNQTALVLSVKNMKNYAGMGYRTWSNGTIFLHIIPYRPNSQYVGSKVLKTGTTLDYNKEITEILNYWFTQGVIPDIALSNMSDGTNLIRKETMVGYESYEPIEILSLGENELFGNVPEN